MVLVKRVAIFDWEWSRNSAPRVGQKAPDVFVENRKLKNLRYSLFKAMVYVVTVVCLTLSMT